MTRLIDADEFELYVQDEWKNQEISTSDWITFREWLRDQETMLEFDGDLTKVIVKGEEYFPVKHGRWISCSSSEHYKCSCCGTRASFWFDEENSSGWHMDMSEWLSDYCPNCGARMGGEENG